MDLIDRQKTIEMLDGLKVKDPFDRYEEQNIGIDWAIDAIKAASAVQTCDDAVSRQAAIDALAEDMPQTYTPDGSHPADEGIFMAQEIYADCIQTLKELPSAQPETAKRIVGKSRDGMTLWYQCDMCNEPVDAQDDFCRGCGRRLTDG